MKNDYGQSNTYEMAVSISRVITTRYRRQIWEQEWFRYSGTQYCCL